MSRTSVLRTVLAITVGVAGVVMAHHPMLYSGFARIQTNLGDSRLIHYLLEHGYRWVSRQPEHLKFWNPPFFFPEKNTAAYSDALLTVGPPYWLCRALGAAPDAAFALWMVAMSTLNYLAGLLFFRRGLGFGIPAGIAGAALIAFGAPRLNEMGHQQLLPFFYPLLTLYALARLFGDSSSGCWGRAGHWLLAMAATVAQLYSAVYVAWFLIVGLGATAVVSLLMPTCRPRFLNVVRRDIWMITASSACGAVLLQPFVSHYLPAANEVRWHDLRVLRALHPRVSSWFDMGPQNWLWGWSTHSQPVGEADFAASAHRLGIGFFTPMACLMGLYTARRLPACRLAAAVGLFIWFATTFMPGAAFARIGLFVTIFCAAGLFHERDEPVWRALGLLLVVCTVVLARSTKPYLTVLGLMVIALCILEIIRARGSRRAWIAPAIALILVGLKFFELDVVVSGLLMVGPVVALAAYYAGPRRWDAAVGGMVMLMVFLVGVTFWGRPTEVRTAFLATLVFLVATAPRRYRPPAWSLARVLLIALGTAWLYTGRDSLWLTYSDIIPGALAIRAVGRVVLILLVPAGLALAFWVEFLEKRRLVIASWGVILLSLAEQGVTTETFDAEANRTTIAKLAGRIDRTRIAFYYHPADGLPFYRHHLDAMWASLATGVPTINGYSGHAPRVWHGFFFADFDSTIEIRQLLDKWTRSHGLRSDTVQFIPEEPAPTGKPGGMKLGLRILRYKRNPWGVTYGQIIYTGRGRHPAKSARTITRNFAP